jgi:anti-anti-sigma regulatory factor
MEWAMRLAQEPNRLGPRYLRDFLGLGRWLPMTLLAGWMQRPYLGATHVSSVKSPQVLHVYLQGKLCSKIAPELQETAAEAIAAGVVMVVHLQGVRQVTAAGLGALMGVRRMLLDAGLTLSLADLKLRHRFLLHAWCAQPLFDEWESAAARGQSQARGLEKTSGVDLHGERKVVPAETRARG